MITIKGVKKTMTEWGIDSLFTTKKEFLACLRETAKKACGNIAEVGSTGVYLYNETGNLKGKTVVFYPDMFGGEMPSLALARHAFENYND